MPHPEITNATRLALQELHLQDEEARPVLALVLRETWRWGGRALERVEPEPPIPLAGEPNPVMVADVLPSARLEPELAFVKPSTDVILLGTARPAQRGAVQGLVRLRAGPIDKTVVVFGERRWTKGLLQPSLSAPLPFEGVPLRWEYAFGGPEERRNPVGMGYFGKSLPFVEESLAPQLELPDQLLRRWRDTPTPAGFGVVGAAWMPRAQYAGTYDQKWSEQRMPALPGDFDRRMFQCAPADQIAPQPFRGDEPIGVEGAGSQRIEWRLPCTSRPVAEVRLRDGRATPELVLDTVVIDADAGEVALTWRGHHVLTRGAHDVRAIAITEAPLPRPRV